MKECSHSVFLTKTQIHRRSCDSLSGADSGHNVCSIYQTDAAGCSLCVVFAMCISVLTATDVLFTSIEYLLVSILFHCLFFWGGIATFLGTLQPPPVELGASL